MADRCRYCRARGVYTYVRRAGRLRRLLHLRGRALRVCATCDPIGHRNAY